MPEKCVVQNEKGRGGSPSSAPSPPVLLRPQELASGPVSLDRGDALLADTLQSARGGMDASVVVIPTVTGADIGDRLPSADVAADLLCLGSSLEPDHAILVGLAFVGHVLEQSHCSPPLDSVAETDFTKLGFPTIEKQRVCRRQALSKSAGQSFLARRGFCTTHRLASASPICRSSWSQAFFRTEIA